ncbi:MAG: flagellar motor switch protein FliG [Desulfobulbus propionicus]|nr:MAG: flagellar motor switch protein FliG [Desulfobulbus propionicus]
MATIEKLNGTNKAAILLMCLGENMASRVMQELSDEEVFKITHAMSTIEHIPEETKQRVLEDFELAMENQAGLVIQGKDFARKVISAAGDEKRVADLMHQFISGAEGKPLETISRMQPAMVADLLEREHPQTMALILSTQSSEHSSAIIANLPEEKRADVVYRIATIDKVSPAVISRIEEAIRAEVGRIPVSAEQPRIGGIAKVVEIFDSMENNMDADILEDLEEVNPDMAEEIRKQMFTFEDLCTLDGRSLQMILREINNDSLAMALKTASDELKGILFDNMSARAAAMIKDDLEALGPVRLSEVEAMQQTIIKIAMRLEGEGKLVLGKDDGNDELV